MSLYQCFTIKVKDFLKFQLLFWFFVNLDGNHFRRITILPLQVKPSFLGLTNVLLVD